MGNKQKPSAADLCRGLDPKSESEHLVVCPVCGQIFDCRDQRQVAHHNAEEHEPLLRDR